MMVMMMGVLDWRIARSGGKLRVVRSLVALRKQSKGVEGASSDTLPTHAKGLVRVFGIAHRLFPLDTYGGIHQQAKKR
jgi:hypothetical protein